MGEGFVSKKESTESLDQRIDQMEEAIINKNKEGFQNQNDAQNFLYEQFKNFFPESSLADEFYSSMSWDYDSLCIVNTCNFARLVRRPEKESLSFDNWHSGDFKNALKEFLSGPNNKGL